MAGSILSMIDCRFALGIFSPEQAAVTAPHFSCPSTSSTLLPRCSTAYSMLPKPTASATLPAERTTKRSPRFLSNSNSGATRLSEHVSTIVLGCCPFDSADRSCLNSRTLGLPVTKRWLPSTKSFQIFSGETTVLTWSARSTADVGCASWGRAEPRSQVTERTEVRSRFINHPPEFASQALRIQKVHRLRLGKVKFCYLALATRRLAESTFCAAPSVCFLRITTSSRRFCARPSSLSLLATGWYSA